MSRLPVATREDLDERGRALYEQMVSLNTSLGNALLGAPLADTAGPANAFLHAPDLGASAMAFGAHVNTRSGLASRTKEIVIMTVAARWQAEFEWWAHERMAKGDQVDPSVVEAIAEGGVPHLTDELDRTMWSVAHQLVNTGHVDDTTYQAAEALVGREELVKVVALCGFYTFVAFVLNTFDADVPEGEQRRWSAPTPTGS
jgi:4-carboxymuconolactone decarboxylase